MARQKAQETWETTEKQVDERLVVKIENLRAWAARDDEVAIKADSTLLRVSKQRDKAQEEIKELKERLAYFENQSQAEKKMVDALEAERDTALLEAARVKVEVEGLQNEALDQYLKGFSTALAQVQTFYPKVDLSNYDPFKKIVDGRLEDLDVDGLTKP